MVQLINPQKTGKNEPCPCESGKKYKKCCGRVNKQMTPRGMQLAFILLVERLSKFGTENGEVVDVRISDTDLQRLATEDKILASKYDMDTDEFIFKVLKVKRSAIIQPDKRIIT